MAFSLSIMALAARNGAPTDLPAWAPANVNSHCPDSYSQPNPSPLCLGVTLPPIGNGGKGLNINPVAQGPVQVLPAGGGNLHFMGLVTDAVVLDASAKTPCGFGQLGMIH